MKKQMMFIALFIFTLTSSYSKNKASTEKIIISTQMQEEILRSPFKAMLNTKDGNQFIAYLFAEDEKKERHHYSFRHSREGNVGSWINREGHYFIYLYDINHNSFLPYKTSIFKDFKKLRFNSDGSRIVVLPGFKKNQSDVLLISQFGNGQADFYEAYGFLDNKPYLQNYIFIGKRKGRQFFGEIYESQNKTNSQLNGWGISYGQTILSLSDKPGIILVKSKNSEK